MDATGSLIIRPREFKPQTGFYYYALVAAIENHAEPLAEFVCNDHRCLAIAYWLKELLAAVSNQTEANVPEKVEIDFSLNVTTHSIDAKCENTSITRTTWHICDWKCQMTIVIHFCCSHMIHAVSRRLFKANPSLSKMNRQAALRAFAVLQNSTRLGEANIAFAHISRLFNLRYHSEATAYLLILFSKALLGLVIKIIIIVILQGLTFSRQLSRHQIFLETPFTSARRTLPFGLLSQK